MMQELEPETPQAEGCGCPEVHLTDDERAALTHYSTHEVPEWIEYCWAERFTKAPVDFASPEPVNWRCPKCKKSIIRTGTRLEEECDDPLDPDEQRLRISMGVSVLIDLRCWSPACDWKACLTSRECEGLVSGTRWQP